MRYDELQKQILTELDRTLSGIDSGSMDILQNLILSAKRVYIAGAGRSGLMARGFAMRLMHMGITAYVVGEIITPAIGKGDLLLIASGSGETASLVSMAKKARSLGAKLALVTIFPESTIGKMADASLKIPAPTPKSSLENSAASIQPMGSLFEQSLMLTLDTLVMMLMEKLNLTSDEMFKMHANLE